MGLIKANIIVMLAFLSLGFYCDKGLRTESNVTPLQNNNKEVSKHETNSSYFGRDFR